jgi:hypothetical protein
MEILVFALAIRNGIAGRMHLSPELAEFRPFDLRALKRSYDAEDNSSGRPSDRRKSLVAQIAS